MRRRFRNPAPVPSGVGSGPAAVAPSPSPVSREEEEASAQIWTPTLNQDGWFEASADECDAWKAAGYPPPLTPGTDPVSNAPKQRGRPKGSKNKVRHED